MTLLVHLLTKIPDLLSEMILTTSETLPYLFSLTYVCVAKTFVGIVISSASLFSLLCRSPVLLLVTWLRVIGCMNSNIYKLKKSKQLDGILLCTLTESDSELIYIFIHLYPPCLNTNSFFQCWKSYNFQHVPNDILLVTPHNSYLYSI